MRLSVGETIQDPAVDLAVTPSDPFVDQAQDDFIWDGLAVVCSLFDFHLDRRVSFGLRNQDFLRGDADKAKRQLAFTLCQKRTFPPSH